MVENDGVGDGIAGLIQIFLGLLSNTKREQYELVISGFPLTCNIIGL